MTRKDLENNRIKEINSDEQMLEIISILNYEECIKVLKECHNLPTKMVIALVDQAKKKSGYITPELLEIVLATLQSLIKKGHEIL